MISIQDHIRSHIRKVETQAGEAPERAACLQIDDVAPISVGATLGLQKGDLLVEFMDSPGGDYHPEVDKLYGPERKYLFYSPATGKRTRVEASGIPLGVDLRPTLENIERDFPKTGTANDLEQIWLDGRWDLLEELSRLMVFGSRKPLGRLSRLVNKQPEYRNNPALMFLGAALFEKGQPKEGLELIHEFLNQYADDWTTNFSGIGSYYLGLAALAIEEADEGLELLAHAWDRTEAPCVADMIEKLTDERPTETAGLELAGKPFPVRYDLERLEDRGQRVSLDATLRKLPPGKLLVVCLLGSYRINGPYNDFMLRYRGISVFFEPYIHELHVITENPQAVPEQYAQYLEGEQKFQEFEDPFELLLDREGGVNEAAGTGYSPCILLLDGSGAVHYRGNLGAIDLWGVLARRYGGA